VREREPGGAADRKKKGRLREKLTDEPPAPGAQGQPHRDLTPPGGPAREQNAGDVGGGNEEHEGHHPRQQRDEHHDQRAVARNQR
jgi:hypothetical protein